MAFPAPVSASPIAVLVDRDAIRAAVGRDVSGDATASMIEAAIIEGIVAVAHMPPQAQHEPPPEAPVLAETPMPLASRWHTAALAVALAASIVLMILAG